MRRAPGLRILCALLSLPAAGSALVILTLPPVSRWLPAALLRALAPLAAPAFDLVARLPPDSLAGHLFWATYAPLPAIFGPAALAAHAALLGLPWLALAGGAYAWARRGERARATA